MKGQSAFIVIIALFLSMVALTVKHNAYRAQIKREWRCNQYGHSIQIWDDSVTPSGATIESINDLDFKLFVESISTYLGQKLPLPNACPPDSKHASEINLIFVRLPLVTSGESPLAPPPKLASTGPADACRLESPWIKLALRRTEQPHLQAIFIWNERQFLLDEYLHSQQSPQKPYDLSPLPSSLFQRYISDYGDSEILRQQPLKFSQTRIPVDLLWLFKSSQHTTFIPFSDAARATMRLKLKGERDKHIRLTRLLVDQCMESRQGSNIRYDTILDLKDKAL